MLRALRIAGLTTLVSLALPTAAYAEGTAAVPLNWSHIAVGLAGLIISIVLLLETLSLRTLALGGAIAEKIRYVFFAIVCLAAAALAQWTGNFVDGLTLPQVQFASQVLVVVAMALFAGYFYSVRAAMQRYMKELTGSERLAQEKAQEWEREIERTDEDGGPSRA